VLSEVVLNADGTATSRPIARTPEYIRDLALADLDGDGALELLMSEPQSTVSVFSRSAEESPIALPTEGGLFAIADFDADQQRDLVVSDRCELRFFDVVRDGPLAFEARGDLTLFERLRCAFITGIVAADLDGDGQDDLAVSHGDYLDLEHPERSLEGGVTVVWSREAP
jgi:hypothetical protein